MKADIPDSIIISRDKDGVIHHSYWTTDQELIPFEDTVYIRKDALLEWLNERYKSTISNVGCYTGHSVWAEVIEHLNEM